MELGLTLSIIGIILAIIGISLALIALIPSKFQKKPKLTVTPGNLDKVNRLKIGQQSDIAFKLTNNGEIVSIDEVNCCFPTQFENITSGPKKLGIYKIPVIIYAEVDTSVLKFPFKYMVNRKERIRDELTIEVTEQI